VRPVCSTRERLRAPEQAFEKYLEAFALAPHQEVVREDVDRLSAGVEGGVTRVIAAYSSAIEGGSDPAEVTELRMSFGGVLTQAGRIDDAIAQYRVVYDEVPDHEGAISALAELYRQTSRFSDMLGIYDRRMELETDPEARRQMAYARASLFVNELADPTHAVEAYQAILSEYGDAEVDAYRALDELFEGQGRWSDFADTVERRILLAESPEEEAALKFRLGRALEEHLDQKPRAVELYNEVVTTLPEHDGAREALEALLVDESVGVQAARILVPIYQVREENERLIRALRVLHRGTTEADERLELLTQIGDVYAYQIENPQKAFDAFCEALREVPSDAGTLARLEAMAIEQENFAPLVELVSELAGGVQDTDLARTLWIKAAQIYDTQLGNVDGAVGAYRKVLDLDPGRPRSARSAREPLPPYGALERLGGRASQPRRHLHRWGRAGAAALADGAHPRRVPLAARRGHLAAPRDPGDRPGQLERARRARQPLRAPGDVDRAGGQRGPSAGHGGRPGSPGRADAAARAAARDAHERDGCGHRDLPQRPGS
jgi:tetratricopeptide (TPR) repeat protein